LGEVDSRYMMGGWVLYLNGVVFALVADNALYLKADETNRHRFVERDLPPFKPFEDKEMVMSYYLAPPEIFEDNSAMRTWVELSVEAGRRGHSRKRRSVVKDSKRSEL
jgi:DNA transformation protein and related proteins